MDYGVETIKMAYYGYIWLQVVVREYRLGLWSG